MEAGALNVIDYIVLAVYLIGVVALGVYLSRRVHTGKDFFLAGRTLPWWAIGMSLVATDIGGTDIIGVGGAAYSYGLAVSNFEWIGCVPAMIVAAFIFVPIFWRAGVYTIPEFLERRFDGRIRTALALCWLIFMACNLGIMLFASAKMMETLFGWDTTSSLVLAAVLVGAYTFAGGLAAVVYTDAIQCAVLIGGCLLVVVLGLIDLGGVNALVETIQTTTAAANGQPSQHMELILPVDTETPFPWTGVFFGLGLILGPAYWIGNQAIIQRSFGAKSEFHAKAAYVWGALLKNLIPVIVAVPGLIALAKFPELKDGDAAFPTLVSTLLPAGLRGLFLAAFLAALMSSVDSYVNSAATIVTHDFYKRFIRVNASERKMLSIGRAVTAALMVWAVGFGYYISRLEGSGIYAIFQTLMAFFQGPAFAVLLAGFFWKRATATGAFIGFLSGVACSITLFALNQEAIYSNLGWSPLFRISEPFLYFSIWAFIVTWAVIALVSFMTKPEPEAKIAPFMYHRVRPVEVAP